MTAFGCHLRPIYLELEAETQEDAKKAMLELLRDNLEEKDVEANEIEDTPTEGL